MFGFRITTAENCAHKFEFSFFPQVPNVRFNVAKCLHTIGSKLNSTSIQAQIKPCLTKLGDDADFDVRFFASEATTGIVYPTVIKIR